MERRAAEETTISVLLDKNTKVCCTCLVPLSCRKCMWSCKSWHLMAIYSDASSTRAGTQVVNQGLPDEHFCLCFSFLYNIALCCLCPWLPLTHPACLGKGEEDGSATELNFSPWYYWGAGRFMQRYTGDLQQQDFHYQSNLALKSIFSSCWEAWKFCMMILGENDFAFFAWGK